MVEPLGMVKNLVGKYVVIVSAKTESITLKQ